MIPESFKQSLSGIPWSRPEDWQQMTEAVRQHVVLQSRWESARDTAGDIRYELSRIFPVLDEFCRRSCPRCPDPYCLNARIWFDTRDLLFLHLSDQDIPQRQPCSDRNHPCRYLGPRGCRLPRLSRPFTCTWFICPTQTSMLRRDPDLPAEDVIKGIQRIKTLRKQLASESGAEYIFLSSRLDNPSANLKCLTMER